MEQLSVVAAAPSLAERVGAEEVRWRPPDRSSAERDPRFQAVGDNGTTRGEAGV